MALTLSAYLPQRLRDDIGQAVSFTVGKRTGVVMQRVRHTTVLEGHKSVELFTEGWSVHGGVVRPGNVDYFLLPYSFRHVDGKVHVDAAMWFVPGDPVAIMAKAGLKRGAVAIAGTLHARDGQVPAAFRPRGRRIERKWTATWKATRYKKHFAPTYKSKNTVVKK
jgi:hypothetical protein